MPACVPQLCPGGANRSKSWCQASLVGYIKFWIWVSFFFFLLEFNYGNVIQVEMCSKSLKVCVFELRGVRESWWDWMAEIGRKASPFCFVSSLLPLCPALQGLPRPGSPFFLIKASPSLPSFPLGAKLHLNFQWLSLYPWPLLCMLLRGDKAGLEVPFVQKQEQGWRRLRAQL